MMLMNVFRMRSAQDMATVQTSLGHSIVIVPLGLQVNNRVIPS